MGAALVKQARRIVEFSGGWVSHQGIHAFGQDAFDVGAGFVEHYSISRLGRHGDIRQAPAEVAVAVVVQEVVVVVVVVVAEVVVAVVVGAAAEALF